MQEFESLKIEKTNGLWGGQDAYGDTVCDITSNYTTNPNSTPDTKTDRLTDDKEMACPSDNTRVQLPYVFPINP